MAEIVKTGVVATLDVLGYVYRVRSLSIDETVAQIIAPIVHAGHLSSAVVLHDYRNIQNAPSLEWSYFADTFVFALPLPENAGLLSKPYNLINSMVYLCELLMRSAFLLNLPMRGAISYGEYCISTSPLYYLGCAFIEAHELQEAQAWAGISLCKTASDIAEHCKSNRFLVYEVPMKDNTEKSLGVVNWCRNFTSDNPDWQSCFNSDNSKIRTYKENTELYFNKYRGHMAGGPIVIMESLIVPSDWKQQYSSSAL